MPKAIMRKCVKCGKKKPEKGCLKLGKMIFCSKKCCGKKKKIEAKVCEFC